jgi:hypothetical protein
VAWALIGTNGIDQATDRVAFGEKGCGAFWAPGGRPVAVRAEMYPRARMPDKCHYRTYDPDYRPSEPETKGRELIKTLIVRIRRSTVS